MIQASSMTRRGALVFGASALAASALPARAAVPRLAVAELFTSQGCSSCPPADALLDDIRKDKNLIALSYNVDYWDYLGWRDTLASPEYSQRQYDYAHSRGDMDVYTPQLIVNGRSHYVGSNRGTVMPAIADAQGGATFAVPVRIEEQGEELAIEIGNAKADGDSWIWIIAVAPSINVKIERGENSGMSIVYANVVRKLLNAGMYHGSDTHLSFAKDSVLTKGAEACVALVQRSKAGPILGAASWGPIGA
jgi:hypothetical protein